MAPQGKWFAASPNTDYIYKALTDGTVTNLTGGKIPKMNARQAAGLIGSWLIETGRRDLSNLDVVEAGSGRGRGLSQYTGVRRGPYDQAVQQARAAGRDPNSAQWQIEYFAKEYLNRDLIGWTQVFERMPQNLKSPGEYARYFTGSAREGKGYFRPGVPHTDRRMQAADEVFRHYSAPKPAAPAATPGQPQQKKGFSIQDAMKWLPGQGNKKKNQSFNTDKMSQDYGTYASAGKFSIKGRNKNKGGGQKSLSTIYKQMEKNQKGSGKAYLSAMAAKSWGGQNGAGIDLSRFQNGAVQAAGNKYGPKAFGISNAKIGQINSISYGPGAPF